MQFKVGDHVRISPRRRVHLSTFSDVGKTGVIARINTNKADSWYGIYEVKFLEEGSAYCKSEDIIHVDGPQIPYDDMRRLPHDKWMLTRRWIRRL